MVELAPLLPVGAAAVLYGIGRRRRTSPQPLARVGVFVAGLCVLVVALSPPLEQVTDSSLTAHMTQHVLLLVAAPLLLVAARPLGDIVLGLPRSMRHPGAVPPSGGSPSGRSRVSPRAAIVVAALVVHVAVMWAWHAPVLYGSALEHSAVHGLEHLSFFGAGLVLWWAVGAGSRARSAAAPLVLFLASLPGTALGAALVLAARPWYPAYTDLVDQQLAGVVMWSAGGALYLVGAAWLFGSWMVAAGRPEAGARPW